MSKLLWSLAGKIVSTPWIANWLIQRAMRTPYWPIVNPDNHDDVYMDRWWLFNPFNKKYLTSGKLRILKWCPLSIQIHYILREDRDRYLHDHPWNFWTIILIGRYTELREDGKLYSREAGDSYSLKFGEYHRITHTGEGEVFTLFITSRYRGTWGYKVDGIKVPSNALKEYMKE